MTDKQVILWCDHNIPYFRKKIKDIFLSKDERIRYESTLNNLIRIRKKRKQRFYTKQKLIQNFK